VKTVTLFQNHDQHVDGKVIHHPAGATVDLPDDEADFVIKATLGVRAKRLELAENTPGTPERMRKNDR
jgi:hypothetical protein